MPLTACLCVCLFECVRLDASCACLFAAWCACSVVGSVACVCVCASVRLHVYVCLFRWVLVLECPRLSVCAVGCLCASFVLFALFD